MRVAILPYTTSGGLSTYAFELSKALAERGLDVILIGIGQGVDSRTFNYSSLQHSKALTKLKDPLLWNTSIGAIASNIIRSSSADIVHCVYPALVPFIRLRKPIVCSGWFNPHNLQSRLSIAIGMSPFSLSRLGELWGQTEYFLLDEFGYRSSRSIFAITKVLEENLRMRFREKVRYLPPGIKLTLEKREKGNNRIRIACIASDLENPRKGVSTLLMTLALLEPSTLKKIEIRLIGGYSERLKTQVDMLRRRLISIDLLGYIPRQKILENLLQTDILVCPSLYEEFGYVVLEAMSAGVTVVATKIRPLTDIITDGVSGFLYEKKSISQLLSIISMLIQDSKLRRKTGEEAQKRILEEFSWNSIAQKLVNYYEEILGTS